MYVRNFSLYLFCFFTLACSDADSGRKIAAFGDSHINKYEFRYFFPGEEIKNFGINGLTTDEISEELNNYVGNAETFIIHAGTNDQIKAQIRNKSQTEFEDEMSSSIVNMVNQFSNSKNYIIIGTLPVTSEYQNQISLNGIEDIWIQTLAPHDNIDFISSSILWDDKNFLDPNYSTDLIHLNELAYQKLTAAINEKLD